MGNVGITLSLSDPAGVNLFEALKTMGFKETERQDVYSWRKIFLVLVEPLIVPEERYKIPKYPNPYPTDYDSVANNYDLDYFVVASRHSSRSGKPCLTVHPTGNFGKAMYGGRARELQKTIANPMRNIFLEIQMNPPKSFEVSLEATHHSPTQFDVPIFFAELGSSERQWRDEKTGMYLANAIISGIKNNIEAPVAVGFGGGHYCPTFSVLEMETAFGHIAAKHSLDLLTEDLIHQMVERTVDGVVKAVLDKGLKGYQRKKLNVVLKKLDIEIETP